MAEYLATTKVYPTKDGNKMSLMDMLAYFEKRGAMRVSDLHIKVGVQPAYRIDGNLVKLKGEVVTKEMAAGLIYPLISEENMAKLEADHHIDCS